jgi:hypothetical protein
MKGKILFASLLMLGLAAAAGARDRTLGLSVQNNIVAMAVDLNPSYAGILIEGGTGALAESAMTRYRTGRVTPLQSLGGTSVLGTNNVQAAPAAPAANTGPR